MGLFFEDKKKFKEMFMVLLDQLDPRGKWRGLDKVHSKYSEEIGIALPRDFLKLVTNLNAIFLILYRNKIDFNLRARIKLCDVEGEPKIDDSPIHALTKDYRTLEEIFEDSDEIFRSLNLYGYNCKKKFEDEYQKKRKDYLGDKYDLDEVYKIRIR